MDAVHSMDQAFIKKLKDALDLNLENEQFGVTELTELMSMSRSSLHLKLKKLTRKSTSQYIREYRLEKAMEMLQNKVATVSEIAYRVGFNSPTYFISCFHNYYGYTPGEVKHRKIEASNRDNNSDLLNKGKRRDKKLSYKGVALLLLIFLIPFIAYFIYSTNYHEFTSSNSELITIDKSIAILPCKNISDDKENQYFADGVMGSIQDHLNKLAGLKVISETSMGNYRETTKSAPEIAEELNVEFLLEASVQQYDNKIRIIAKLIDAKNDQQIWSETYDRELENIFTLQSEIAKQIATELKIALPPADLERMNKIPSDNLEAYNLYLKGRFLLNKDYSSEKNLRRSIYYFEQSIEIDPENAMAYAGMADAYLFLTGERFISYSKGTEIVKEMALKAIELDNTLAEAHTTLGWLALWIEWNWKEAEKRLKLAIELNPNSAVAHSRYARYLYLIEDRSKEARKQINKALYLEPLSYNLYLTSIILFWEGGQFDQAIVESTKAQELDKNRPSAYWLNFGIYLTLGNDRKAVTELQKIMRLDAKTVKYVNIIEDIYDRTGIKGVLRWLINFDENEVQHYSRPFYLAQMYAFLGENEKAMTLLEKCYKMRVPLTIKIRNNPYFKNLRTEDRFLELMEKMGLNNPVNE